MRLPLAGLHSSVFLHPVPNRCALSSDSTSVAGLFHNINLSSRQSYMAQCLMICLVTKYGHSHTSRKRLIYLYLQCSKTFMHVISREAYQPDPAPKSGGFSCHIAYVLLYTLGSLYAQYQRLILCTHAMTMRAKRIICSSVSISIRRQNVGQLTYCSY